MPDCSSKCCTVPIATICVPIALALVIASWTLQVHDSAPQSTDYGMYHLISLQSESNVQNVIVSDPAVGIDGYGLTEVGRHQAREACGKLRTLLASEDDLPGRVVVVSSDFKRTRETAEIIHSELQVSTQLRLDQALRERDMGRFNLTDGGNVHRVWDRDSVDPADTSFGNESVMDVMLRMSRALHDLNAEFESKIILMVTHGDPALILHGAFLGIEPSEIRSKVPEFGNCDIVELKC